MTACSLCGRTLRGGALRRTPAAWVCVGVCMTPPAEGECLPGRGRAHRRRFGAAGTDGLNRGVCVLCGDVQVVAGDADAPSRWSRRGVTKQRPLAREVRI